VNSLKFNYPAQLPVVERRQEILDAIEANQVIVLAGATGSGKTTQLPKMCLELGRKSIAHTQPRRIAARSVAERIAEELEVELGGLVGYQVRFTDQASKSTKIKVMTDGILLNSLQRDLLLKRYDTIIIDEAHERSLNIDFLLGYIKQLLPKRPDLKVIITSATIDPESFSKHFNDAPIIEVSGRTYPIDIFYRPVTTNIEDNSDVDDGSTANDYLDGVVKALVELQDYPQGDSLVFLSGESEIRDAQDVIAGKIASGILDKATEVLPLYGRLSSAEQHRVFEPSKVAGVKRRVILATNVAETSLTIPNIKYVIDAGTARISRYSPRAKVQRLPIEAISQASANQRSGRAGRTSAGIAIRLYSKEDFEARPEFTDPEILRTNLAAVILQAAASKLGDIRKFPFLQPPDARGVKDGVGLLKELGGIVEAENGQIELTEIGKNLALIPIEPRFARMLVASKEHSLTREVMIIVAGLTIQDPRERPLEKREAADRLHARFTDQTSDFLTLLNLWNHIEDQQQKLSSSAFRRLCKQEFLNYLRVREWQDLVRQLKGLTKPLGLDYGKRKKDPDGIHKALLAGLLSQIGIQQLPDKPKPKAGKPVRAPVVYLGANNKKYFIFPGSALARKAPEAMMSAELVETSRLFARMNAAIDPEWAEQLAGDLCKRSVSEPHWEKKLGAVIGFERVNLFGVPIVQGRKVQYSKIDPMFCRELFIRHALVYGQWDSKQVFFDRNAELLADLESQAEASRAPQLAPNEDDIFLFYNNRIPLDVVSTRSFEGWWKQVRVSEPEFLTMTRDQLLGSTKAELDKEQYPGEITVDGQDFSLSYIFDPGSEHDGMCVDVPIALLASVSPEGFQWLIPALRLELITELIRSLPKPVRKHVVPAKDWAQKVHDELPAKPTGSVTEVLASLLQTLSGARVAATDFNLQAIPASLQVSYRVLDAKAKQLAIGNDLRALQDQLSGHAVEAVAEIIQFDGPSIEADDLQAWDMDDLPTQLVSSHGTNKVNAYPALVVDPKSRQVNLRLLSSSAKQHLEHPLGVAELIQKTITSPVKYIESHLTQPEKLAIASLPYPSLNAFVLDVIRAGALKQIQEVAEQGLIFTKKDFDRARQLVEAISIELVFDVAKLILKISRAASDATKTISGARAMDFLTELASEKLHIQELLQDNLVSSVGLERLGRIEVYLKAITQRVIKLQEQPDRDRLHSLEVSRAIEAYEAAGGRIPVPHASPKNLVAARWLLEELRVSLFAQSLGTSEPVSLKRIQKQLS